MSKIVCLIAFLFCGNVVGISVGEKHRIDVVNYDDFYSVNVSIGVPAQWFSVQLDTATADFWVVDSECPADQCLGRHSTSHRRYIQANSKTYESDGTEFMVSNGHRSVWGIIGHERIQMGNLVVESQAFGRGRLLELQMGIFPIDGVLGLGPPQSSQSGARPFIQAVSDDFNLNKFTIWLDKAPLRPKNGAVSGMLTIGDEDTDHCAEDWTKLNRIVSEKRFWAVNVESISIGSRQFMQAFSAIIDTATAFISAPSAKFEAILSELKAHRIDLAGLWAVSCGKKYPPIEFHLGGKRFIVEAEEYIRQTDIGCVLALGNSSTSVFETDNFWVFGTPFLRRRCVQFDLHTDLIQLTNSK